ncbi:MAG: hypothetical protein LYZ69_02910 [Nitrososphaerales archaeon]|nr:hypothetical protein [Nitrososphaerales archaeon]
MSLEGGEARVDLRPVSALLPHEETIQSQVERLAGELKRDGMQKDPIIVDHDTGAVLDGMHRLSALASMGIGYAVCFTVDYSSRAIMVKRWARVYGARSADQIKNTLGEAGLSERCPTSEAIEKLEDRHFAVAAMTETGGYVPSGKLELEGGFDIMRKIDEMAAAAGWTRRFLPEDDIDVPLQKRGNLILLSQRLTKQDVITAARTKHLFPCKTSMHVIDLRPVSANVPLAELREGSRKTLDARLRAPHTLLPPNSAYGGRRYKERLLVLGGQ